MTRLFYLLGLAFAGTFWGTAAEAQSLSDGDYEQCSVYDQEGDFVGYSNECLERKRARIRAYQGVGSEGQHHGRSGRHRSDTQPTTPAGQRFRPVELPRACPLWANGGRGYVSTMVTTGGFFGSQTFFGTFDSMFNGRPCFAKTYITRGYP